MSNETPPSNEPDGKKEPLLKIVWLLIALSPALLILSLFGEEAQMRVGIGMFQFICLWLNLIVSCGACFMLLQSPRRDIGTRIIGGIFLGMFFAALNFGLAVFAGCVLHPVRF